MSVQRSAFGFGELVAEGFSSTCSRTTPEQLFKMCMNASYSPWRSLMKCSVPLGRFKMAWRLMISVNAACWVGNCCESSERYFHRLLEAVVCMHAGSFRRGSFVASTR